MDLKIKRELLDYLHILKSFGITYHDVIPMNLIRSDISHDNYSLDMIEHCMLCDGSKINNNKIVSCGDSNSNLIIISIGVIQVENELNLLKNMLNNVLCLNFASIYMLNIVKCHIEKKQIKEDFIVKCLPYTVEQLRDLDKSKKILFIGDSYKYLINTNSNAKYGTIVDFNGHKSLLIPELDYLIKNPSMKKDLMDGLKRMKILLGT